MEEPPELTSSASGTTMPLGAKLANIFVTPGDVFDDLKLRLPAWPNWLAPLALMALLGIISTLVIFSQPAILQTIQNSQDQAENTIRQQVAAGKMPQTQANQALWIMGLFSGPSALKTVGIISSLFGSPLQLLIEAAFVWLVGKFALRAEFSFHRAVEITGLSMMIAAMGLLVAMLLAVINGNLTSNASPTLLLGHFNPQNPLHAALASLNVFSIWRVAVISLGLSRLTGAKAVKASVWTFGIWLLWKAFNIGLLVLLIKLRLPQT
jgi:hypothetical protein